MKNKSRLNKLQSQLRKLRGEKALAVLVIFALIGSLIFLSSWILMTLFNIIANYFGFKTITFLVSMCIVAILSYLKLNVVSSK